MPKEVKAFAMAGDLGGLFYRNAVIVVLVDFVRRVSAKMPYPFGACASPSVNSRNSFRGQDPKQKTPSASHKSCARTSLFSGDEVRALIVGFFRFFFLVAVVLGPPKRAVRSADTRVS